MKVPLQEKIAELERRIVALEQRPTFVQTTIRGASTETVMHVEREVTGLWKAFDALMAKAFKR